MPEEIMCPECDSPNPHNLHAEGNVGARVEGKPLPRSPEIGPKYECRKCGHRFNDSDLQD